jgi:DNA-binding NarL/FixJ family response regulator
MGDTPLSDATVEPSIVSSDRAPARVALANDYIVVVAGLSALLEPFSDRIEIVDWLLFCGGDEPADEFPVPHDGADLVAPHPGREPLHAAVDLVLFDTFGRPELGLGALEELLVHPRARRVALYTGETDRHRISGALEMGIAGVVSKSLPATALVRALERMVEGEVVVQLGDVPSSAARLTPNWPGRRRGLSERESEVLALITQGLRNQEIAQSLYLSVDTVKSHVKAVYRKLGVRNRAAAVSAAFGDESFDVRREGGWAP